MRRQQTLNGKMDQQSFIESNSLYPPSHYEIGQTQGKSDSFNCMETQEIEDTSLPTSSANLVSRSPMITGNGSCTLESPRPNKRKISSVNAATSSSSTQSYSRMSGLVSTSKGAASRPFWTESTKEWSRKLWLCTKTALRELDASCWNLPLRNLGQNSWFTVKVKMTPMNTMISCPSSLCLSRPITENAERRIAKEEEKKMKSKRAKLAKEEEDDLVRLKRGMTDVEKQRLSELNEELENLQKQYNMKGVDKKTINGLKRRCENDINKLKAPYIERPVRPEEKEHEDSPDSDIFRATRFKVRPRTQELRTKLNQWFGSTRFVYNKCVQYSKEHPEWFSKGSAKRIRDLRDFIKKEVQVENPWLTDIPGEIKDLGVTDFNKAVNTNFDKNKARKKRGESPQPFTMHPRSAKNMLQQTLRIRARDFVRPTGVYSDLRDVYCKEKLPQLSQVESSVTITKTRDGWFYYTFLNRPEINDTYTPPLDTVAIDPGVRTFMTMYDTHGNAIEWGAGDMNRIFAIMRHADKLQSKFSSLQDKKSRKYTRMKKAWLRMLTRVKFKISEVHRKAVRFLCSTYKTILLPDFDSRGMSNRATRKIGSKTARSMLTWSHSKFRELLKAKVHLYTQCHLVICDEAYTSKTCGNCGHIHHGLGSSKIFECPTCAYTADRDINAARNILLRYLTTHPEILSEGVRVHPLSLPPP